MGRTYVRWREGRKKNVKNVRWGRKGNWRHTRIVKQRKEYTEKNIYLSVDHVKLKKLNVKEWGKKKDKGNDVQERVREMKEYIEKKKYIQEAQGKGKKLNIRQKKKEEKL